LDVDLGCVSVRGREVWLSTGEQGDTSWARERTGELGSHVARDLEFGKANLTERGSARLRKEMARFVFSVGRKEYLTIGFPITRGKRKFCHGVVFWVGIRRENAQE
jgi:hypothetical protein